MTLAARFHHTQTLDLAGFDRQPVPYGGLSARLLSAEPIQVQFDLFANRVVAAIGRRYLPIYRMADGEFAFLLGWQRPLTERTLWKRVRGSLSRLKNNVLRSRFSTMWGEAYDGSERATALARLEAAIREIAAHGILAIYFMRRGDRWSEEFFEPLCAWFDRHGIALDRENYVPFYFVYALLNGPRRNEVFRGRRILVVTHLTPERTSRVERALMDEGAASVAFLPVSASKALFDVIDPTPYKGRIDLVLVAAGIGSASILTQLAPLSVPSIDAGIVVECLIDPSRRGERPFLMGDDRRSSAV